ncbi:MAG: hypothetical protein R3A48_12820 [Polyangiales bacterium]
MPTTIRVPDLAQRLDAQGLTTAELSLVRLTLADVDRLTRGDSITVRDAGPLAKLLGVRVSEIEVSAGRGSADEDPSEGGAPFEVDSYPCDDDPVVIEASAPAPREDTGREEATVPPMEVALRAVVADAPGLYRDEDLELVGAVLSLGEAPSGVSRRGMEVIARGWLDLALGCRGMEEDAVPAILAAALASDESRVRGMGAKITARLEGQRRAPARGATKSGSSKSGAKGSSKAQPEGDVA